jgi:hypothetical protein
MGSLAVGGAAAIGTGAFSDVSANRTVSVKVAPDSDAYLTLKTDGNENAAYADGSSAQMTVDLDGSDSNPAGSGVNQDATTRIFDIFSIQNQGANEALVFVPPRSLSGQGAFDLSDDGIYFDPQVSGMPNGRSDDNLGTLVDGTLYTSLTGIGGSGDTFEEDVLESNTQVPCGPAVYLLRPGEEFDFGVYVKTNDSATGSIDYDMEIKANADLADEARNQGVMTVSQNM